jgi:chaperonin GroES
MNTEMNLSPQETMDETPQQDINDEQNVGLSFRKLVESTNIAESLDEEELTEIGSMAKRGYEADKDSRIEWEDSCESWMKLAKQFKENKTFPWPDASNVKYPLLTTAAMQFGARAYPSLVPSNGNIVKVNVVGKDADGSKLAMAERTSTYMSHQIMKEIVSWEESMDKLLMQLPIIGMVFKKTYWDTVQNIPCSKVILPNKLVVNYWAKSLLEAERISEEIEMSPRILKERQLSKVFLENLDLGKPPIPDDWNGAYDDDTVPYCFIEQHTYLDLDDDGYKEPYIVTFHKETGIVARIVARYEEKNVLFGDKNQIIRIDPIQYYTKFGFIPNPDGSFYDIGFGCLLGPLNESVNTLINQLVDAGTLNNLQGGFLGKGLRLRSGEYGFKPGEWKPVNAMGDDLKKQIVPLPSKEPSNVLFQLMGSLITSGKELASIAEIFVGKMPGQNTPATTTMATVEQGMKVFTAVYKRIYRSLTEEFYKLYELNGIYLNPNTYADIVDVEINPDDFKNKYSICPGADPSSMTQTEKLMKAQGLLELLPLGALDPVAVIKRVLEAQEQPNWEQLLIQQVAQTGQMPEPPPDPKLQEMQMKGQMEQQKMALQEHMQQSKLATEGQSAQLQMAMKSQAHNQKMQQSADLAKLKAAEMIHKQRIFSVTEQAKMNQKLLQQTKGGK